jgi:hypothetical protein
MVRLVNLDEEGDSEAGLPNHRFRDELTTVDDNRPNPNLNLFTAALSCYP